MTWREELIIRMYALRYAFKPDASAEESQEGVDSILLAVSDFRKESFFSGYREGARDAALDLEVEFNSDLNRLGAEKRYQELLAE